MAQKDMDRMALQVGVRGRVTLRLRIEVIIMNRLSVTLRVGIRVRVRVRVRLLALELKLDSVYDEPKRVKAKNGVNTKGESMLRPERNIRTYGHSKHGVKTEHGVNAQDRVH